MILYKKTDTGVIFIYRTITRLLLALIFLQTCKCQNLILKKYTNQIHNKMLENREVKSNVINVPFDINYYLEKVPQRKNNAAKSCNCNLILKNCMWYCQNIYKAKGWVKSKNFIINLASPEFSLEIMTKPFINHKTSECTKTNLSSSSISSSNPLLNIYKSKIQEISSVSHESNKSSAEKEICDFLIYLKEIEKEKNMDSEKKNLIQNIIYKYFTINNLSSLECTLNKENKELQKYLENNQTFSFDNSLFNTQKSENIFMNTDTKIVTQSKNLKYSKIYFTSTIYYPSITEDGLYKKECQVKNLSCENIKNKKKLCEDIKNTCDSQNTTNILQEETIECLQSINPNKKQDSLIKANILNEKRLSINKALDSAEVSLAKSITKSNSCECTTKYVETTSFMCSTPYYTLSIPQDKIKTVTVTYNIKDGIEKNIYDSPQVSAKDIKQNDIITIDDIIEEVKENTCSPKNETIKKLIKTEIKKNLNPKEKSQENCNQNDKIKDTNENILAAKESKENDFKNNVINSQSSELKELKSSFSQENLSVKSGIASITNISSDIENNKLTETKTIFTTIYIANKPIEKTLTDYKTQTLDINSEVEVKLSKILSIFKEEIKNNQTNNLKYFNDKIQEIKLESNTLKKLIEEKEEERKRENVLKNIKENEIKIVKEVINSKNNKDNKNISESINNLSHNEYKMSSISSVLLNSSFLSNAGQPKTSTVNLTSSKDIINSVDQEKNLFIPVNITSLISSDIKSSIDKTINNIQHTEPSNQNYASNIVNSIKNDGTKNITCEVSTDKLLIVKTIELDDQNNLEIKISQE